VKPRPSDRRGVLAELAPWAMILGGVGLTFLDGPAPVADVVGLPLAAGGVGILVYRGRK
jgi:hypothetical protein